MTLTGPACVSRLAKLLIGISFLVCYHGVGKRAKRLVFSRHKYLRSRLNPSQVNC